MAIHLVVMLSPSRKSKSSMYLLRQYKVEKWRKRNTNQAEPISKKQTDKFYNADSRDLKDIIPNDCVTLIVTSPPYNLGKEYETELDIVEYLNYLDEIWAECFRILRPGGRLCINVPGIGRTPYHPLHSYITNRILNTNYPHGEFMMRGEVIWNKGRSVGTSTAWGSWRSPTNPTLRDVHEYIIIFCKIYFNIPKNGIQPDIESKEFTEYTKSIWDFSTESAKRIGHPAPFPLELPQRFIKLYTFPGDLVVDPCCGSGTTCIAAAELGRRWIGVDISKDYIDLAKNRFKKHFQ